MSEDELYEIARQRVDQRNRRWTLWAFNLGGLILSLALLILVKGTLVTAIFMGWIGVFVVHTIVAALAESRDGEIESQVAKLREAASVYEKPKRLELGEDGELVENSENAEAYAQRSRNS
jgi:hypothetical protein